MAQGIEINCKKVFDNGKDYIKCSDEVIEIQKDLDNIATEIGNIWANDDIASHNFLVTFNQHIKNLDLIINFLGANGLLLKRNALEHGNIDDNLATQIERSELDDEREFRY